MHRSPQAKEGPLKGQQSKGQPAKCEVGVGLTIMALSQCFCSWGGSRGLDWKPEHQGWY